MSAVEANPSFIKEAFCGICEFVGQREVDLVRAEAGAILYEMEKGASCRVPNLAHPIAVSYAALVKLAEGQALLEKAGLQIRKQYNAVEKAIQEGLVNASSF
jgi:hypothetical protein